MHKEIGASAAAFPPPGTEIPHGLPPTHPHSPEDFGLGQVSPLLAPVPLPPEGWRRAFGSQVRCLFLALASHASSCLPSVSSCRLKQSPEQEGDRAAPCAARPPREEAWEGARPQGEGQVTRAARFY